jgi:hypothetical protein
MFVAAGFRNVRVTRTQREGTIGSFEEYWAPIETGMGSMPQVYLSLPETERRLVREEVQSRLSRFESHGKLVMSVEMLIAAGTA